MFEHDKEAGITEAERAAFERILLGSMFVCQIMGDDPTHPGDVELARNVLHKTTAHYLAHRQ